MRQVIGILDSARTGYMSRKDFSVTLRRLESNLSLDEARMLMTFFDDKNTGKISVFDVVKAIQDILNSQASGGLYAFMQVQPILTKIINELAVDCDKFFDEVADLNQQCNEDEDRAFQEARERGQPGRFNNRQPGIGLNKRLFYSHLQKYGIQLDEDQKTLINTVFTISVKDSGAQSAADKFDYIKLDAAFEGV
jgi:hypothetical protein